MHVWLDLILRELLFLALLGALGSGPATFLPRRFDGVARAALAPVLGMCVGTCVTVTLVYFFAASETGWLVILLALASLAVAVWRTRRTWSWPGWRGAIQLATVVAVILAVLQLPTGRSAHGWPGRRVEHLRHRRLRLRDRR